MFTTPKNFPQPLSHLTFWVGPVFQPFQNQIKSASFIYLQIKTMFMLLQGGMLVPIPDLYHAMHQK